MIDGITINFELLDFVSWKQLTALILKLTTDTDGTIDTKKRENKLTTTYFKKWETFTLTVKEVEDIETRQCKVYLTVGNGSLHKNHFEGANYLPFSYELLQ